GFMMSKVAILGYGVVGSGVYEILKNTADQVAKNAGKSVEVKYILDIGSSAIRLLAVTKFNNAPRVFAEEEILYDGYMDGEFLSPDDLSESLSQLIDKMNCKIGKRINSVIVGVPGDFCVCVCKRISRKFPQVHKIKQSDLVEMFVNNASFKMGEDSYEVINYSAMQYIIDNDEKIENPVGKKSSSLIMDASYILAKKSFIEIMQQKLNELKIENIDFISSALGQALACESGKDMSKMIAIIDVGHITTTVAVRKGEGLALLNSFSMGGGHISSDIMQVLGVNFKNAEMIKRKVVLTVETERNSYYEACIKGNLVKAPINITNQVVKSRIETLAKIIKEILDMDEVFTDVDIYLTGDGISNFKGVKNILQDITGHKIFDFNVPLDNSRSKYQTSKIGLAKLSEVVK
ncbi:MAG: hypothetical protein IKA36_04830, partial [Clostridia bacterium]|nr:hypothetical protein [Clostridia bacterium]